IVRRAADDLPGGVGGLGDLRHAGDPDRPDPAVLRPAHPPRGLRHRDADRGTVTGRRRRAAVALLLGVAASLVVAIHGGNAQAPAPGVEFVAALHDAYDALPPGDAVPGADARLQRVRAPLQLAATLAPSSSALAPVIADLERDPADVADARIRLRALVDALALPPGSVAQDPGAAQSTLH